MNYKESSISGTAWHRAHDINISNQYNQAPIITFYEEEILDINSNNYQKEIGNIREVMTDPNAMFNLVNPIDGTTIGTAHYVDLQIMLFSLYIHLANLRDNPPA